MEMRTYDCVLVSQKNKDHKIPLTAVTKQELQLLAFIHGPSCIPVETIKPRGPETVSYRNKDGVRVQVESEMDEYMRLALKYDQFVNPGRGKKYVEDCFKVTLGGFDAILSEINAIDAMDAAVTQAEQAEASKVITEGATARREVEAAVKARAGDEPPVGSRVFGTAGRAG